MASISKKVRDLIRERLISVNGLNAQIATLFPASGVLDLPVIDWSVEARQFFQANVNFDDLVGSDTPVTPCVILYTTRAENQNRVKYRTFAGQITAQLDVIIESVAERSPDSLEDYADLIDEALMRCLNGVNWDAVNGTTNVAYNGQISTQRTPAVTTNSSNWRQVISATITFEVTL